MNQVTSLVWILRILLSSFRKNPDMTYIHRRVAMFSKLCVRLDSFSYKKRMELRSSWHYREHRLGTASKDKNDLLLQYDLLYLGRYSYWKHRSIIDIQSKFQIESRMPSTGLPLTRSVSDHMTTWHRCLPILPSYYLLHRLLKQETTRF
jgi:hypothetical protein